MDDLIQVLFFLFIVIFGLLGGSKRKKGETSKPRARPRAVDRESPRRRPLEAPAGRPRPVEARRPVQARERLEASLYDLLRGAELERATPESEIRSAEETLPEEARSLETLVAAGGESHQRFHQRYLDTPVAPPSVSHRGQVIPLSLHRRTLRDAVIWTEVLGRPKGLDEYTLPR